MKDGDGSGSSEIKLEGTYTIQDCIATVKAKHPKANGITVDKPCINKCNCYAEFSMSGWLTGRARHQACIFEKPGNQLNPTQISSLIKTEDHSVQYAGKGYVLCRPKEP